MPDRGPHPHRVLIVDSRDPWPHPWRYWLPAGVEMRSGSLEVGRIALAGNIHAAVIDRKSISELLVAIGPERAAYEAELRESRHCGRYAVVVEGTLEHLIAQAPRIRPQSIIGTLAAWSRRYCPFQFCGNRELAAAFALRFLLQPEREAADVVRSVARAGSRIVKAAETDAPTAGVH